MPCLVVVVLEWGWWSGALAILSALVVGAVQHICRCELNTQGAHDTVLDAVTEATAPGVTELAAILTPSYLRHLTRDGTLVDGGVRLRGADARDEDKVQAAMRAMMTAAWKIQLFVRRTWHRRFYASYDGSSSSSSAGRQPGSGSGKGGSGDEPPHNAFENFRSVAAAHGSIATRPKPMLLPGLTESATEVANARQLLTDLAARCKT